MKNDNSCFLLVRWDNESGKQIVAAEYHTTREEFNKLVTGALNHKYDVYEARRIGSVRFNTTPVWEE